ncbi:MAG: hypothetical protein ICV60_13925 [Pyrinomonadaceae bacterium]|nr:hypothetical protein [Pyrinomonadaceae bacterium]
MQTLLLRIPLGKSLRLLAVLLLLSPVFLFCFEQRGAATGSSALEGDKVWLIVKARERRLELVGDYSYRMDGSGQVNFKEGGRVVELPEGLTVLVDDKRVEGEQRVNEDETVRVVNSRGETLWKLSPVRKGEMSW